MLPLDFICLNNDVSGVVAAGDRKMNGDCVMFASVMRRWNNVPAALHEKSARALAVLVTLIATSVAVNTLLIVLDGQVR